MKTCVDVSCETTEEQHLQAEGTTCHSRQLHLVARYWHKGLGTGKVEAQGKPDVWHQTPKRVLIHAKESPPRQKREKQGKA